MKIAFIATQWRSHWAGSEELWWKTALLALDRGHQVAAVIYRWPEVPPKIRQLRERGAWLFQMDRPTASRWSPFLHGLPRFRFERFRIWGALASWKPDAICISQGGTYDVYENGVFDWFLNKHRFPYTVICQWHYEDMVLPHDGVRRLADTFFASARHVAFVSERNLRAVERQIARDLPNACVVRNPVNLSDFSPVSYPRSREVWMANVARHDVQAKGQDVLLEALGKERWRGRDWRLRLYGSGPDREYLERLAAYYQVADKVEFRGHVGDIRSIWADNQLLVMPSRSEGTPMALVEAMLCARPSVVTDVGGNVEWVEEPATGFVADAPLPGCLDAALGRAWEARDRWESIGRHAHEVALARIDPHPDETVLAMLTEARESGVSGQ